MGVTFENLEGRIYGARYYTCRPNFEWWNPGGLTGTTWDDMDKWCTETFGEIPDDCVWIPGLRWYANNGKFWFRNEADRTLFVLRWS